MTDEFKITIYTSNEGKHLTIVVKGEQPLETTDIIDILQNIGKHTLELLSGGTATESIMN